MFKRRSSLKRRNRSPYPAVTVLYGNCLLYTSTTITPRGREFLNYAQKNGAVVSLSDELPQSYVLADGAVVDTVYLSELSPAAMRRRAEKMIE